MPAVFRLALGSPGRRHLVVSRVVSVVIFHPGGSGRAALYMQGRALVSSGECRVASSREVAVGSRVAGRRSVVHGDPRLAVRVAAALRAALRVAVRTRQTCLSTSHDEKARSRGFCRSCAHPAVQDFRSRYPRSPRCSGQTLGLEPGRVPNRSHQAARQLGRCLRIWWTPPALIPLSRIGLAGHPKAARDRIKEVCVTGVAGLDKWQPSMLVNWCWQGWRRGGEGAPLSASARPSGPLRLWCEFEVKLPETSTGAHSLPLWTWRSGDNGQDGPGIPSHQMHCTGLQNFKETRACMTELHDVASAVGLPKRPRPARRVPQRIRGVISGRRVRPDSRRQTPAWSGHRRSHRRRRRRLDRQRGSPPSNMACAHRRPHSLLPLTAGQRRATRVDSILVITFPPSERIKDGSYYVCIFGFQFNCPSLL